MTHDTPKPDAYNTDLDTEHHDAEFEAFPMTDELQKERDTPSTHGTPSSSVAPSSEPITKDMLIDDIVEQHPELV